MNPVAVFVGYNATDRAYRRAVRLAKEHGLPLFVY